MEYNEKLSHLTPDQIDDIVRMYSDKTFKVADSIILTFLLPLLLKFCHQ